MAFRSSLFSICPRIYKKDGLLVASTSWKFRVLTLGMLSRRVEVDRERKAVVIQRRYVWFITFRRRIPFQFIEAVTYGYNDIAAAAPWSLTHDGSDLFRVGLRLHGLEEVHLFFFYGDGTFTNNGPFPDWLYWPNYVFDVTGTQDKESQTFAKVLSNMIAAPVEPASH
jgi:hypothetical protein